jgi:hypothetical protein
MQMKLRSEVGRRLERSHSRDRTWRTVKNS